MNVADYVIKFLEEKGVTNIFSLTGGGAMYLNDAVAKSTRIKPTFMHHEQSCAMAATAYSKTTNTPGVILVTSGCGSTNTITGVLDAWQDSNPLIIISGQANLNTTTEEYYNQTGNILRKYGVQEVDIIEIVKSITKYAKTLDNSEDVNYELEKLWTLATTGRKGPVWLNIPLDIQSKEANPNSNISMMFKMAMGKNAHIVTSQMLEIKNMIKNSIRPVIVLGNGVLLSGVEREEVNKLTTKHKIPVVTTFVGRNSTRYDIGHIGIKGTRAGNFAVQNADLIIAIGTSLSIPAIGFQTQLWAREAKKIVIDIDPTEHSKPTINIDYFIYGDAKDFIKRLNKINTTNNQNTRMNWLVQCRLWQNKWSPFNRPDIDSLNMYSFSKTLSEYLEKNKEFDDNSITITDAGSAYYVLSQSLICKELIIPAAQGEMGFMIPATVGAYEAHNGKKKIIGVTGEGSFQFNIQELQTIAHHKMPIALFVLNNNGYLSIKTTQNKFFESRISGADKDSGVSFPDLKLVSQAYGIEYIQITELDELKQYLPQILEANHPIICEIICPEDEVIYPTSATKQMEDGSLKSQPLENMFPFLSQEEFEREMKVSILK